MEAVMQTRTGNPHVHPIFSAAVAAFSPAGQAQIANANRAAYVRLLQRHDWSFQHSDDPQRYAQGQRERAELRMVAHELDADYSIWNSHAPAAHANGGGCF
jgi:hypothetical protein